MGKRHMSALLGEENQWAFVTPPMLLVLSMLMASGYIVLGRAVSVDIPPVGLVFWRTLVAVAILGLLFAPRIRRQWYLLQSNWRILLSLGALQAVTGHMLLLSGLKSTTRSMQAC